VDWNGKNKIDVAIASQKDVPKQFDLTSLKQRCIFLATKDFLKGLNNYTEKGDNRSF
jgi:hypothetical protein